MSTDESKSYREVVQQSKRREEYKEHERQLQAAIEECSFQLDDNRISVVANICRDFLVPGLLPEGYPDLVKYDNELADDDRWDWLAIYEFVSDPDKILKKLFDGDSNAEATVESAYYSLEAIAEYEGVIDDELRNKVLLKGWSSPLGYHLQKYEMNLGDEVRAVTDDSGMLKSLYCGETGQGKSAIEELEAIDFWNAGNRKLVDCVDMDKFENCVWDIPQMQEDLRNIREQAGFAPDFTESDEYNEPQIEILVPMCEELREKELTYDTESDEFEVRPFTIPASSLSQEMLVALISEDLSKQQRTTIKHAYQDVDADNDDWTLGDLAEEIKQRSEMDEVYQKRAINILKGLQRVGFIRSAESEYTLDLEEMMRDTDTITAISQAVLDDELARLMVVSYFIDAIYRVRRQNPDLPKLGLLIRELHEVVPQRNRTGVGAQAEALQGVMATRLSKLMRKNRFYGVQLYCDTQYPSDVQKGVRGGFNRAIAFDTPNADIETLIESVPTDKTAKGGVLSTINAKSGQATILGLTEPSVNRDHIEFLGPCEMLPSPTHHFDADLPSAPDTGLHSRARYIDHLDIRTPAEEDVDWPFEYDDDLKVSTDMDPEEYDPEKDPMGAFVEECIEETGDIEDWVHASTVREVYSAFADEYELPHKEENAKSFGSELTNYAEIPKVNGRRSYPREGEGAYHAIKLTDAAKELKG